MVKVPVLVLILGVLGASLAQECVQEDNCNRPDCVCAAMTQPVQDPPQLVVLTFDDSIVDQSLPSLYMPLLRDRVNPDGAPISGTFYVPHIYTSYIHINELYNMGYEIGDHSISKNPIASYWTESPLEVLVQEFEGQRTILSNFANIPIEAVTSLRVPFLALASDKTFEAMVASGIKTDNSWATRSLQKYYPYTLDFLSPQECLGNECPTKPFPGFWVDPIVNFVGLDGAECHALFMCTINGTTDSVSSWLRTEFDKIYTTNRAPITYMLNSVFFNATTNSPGFTAFKDFLDDLSTLPDVFLVSNRQVVDWMKNPVPASEYSSAQTVEPTTCSGVICPLEHTNENGDSEIRYMHSCVPCPDVYPWVGNPLGEAQA